MVFTEYISKIVGKTVKQAVCVTNSMDKNDYTFERIVIVFTDGTRLNCNLVDLFGNDSFIDCEVLGGTTE